MTAIAGITDGTTVWLGADSAHSTNWDTVINPAPKVFTSGPYAFGLTGSPRMAQILRYTFKPPVPGDDTDLLAHMCTTFVDDLRTCLKEAGFAKKDSERESAAGSTFFAATYGRLFKVWEDYQVSEREDGIDAAGCGEDFVLGSLHTSAALGWEPQKRLLSALEAADRFSAGVACPFHLISVAGRIYEGDTSEDVTAVNP